MRPGRLIGACLPRLCLAGVLAASRSAQAAEKEALDLRWRVPAGCPSREFVETRLRALLGDSADRMSRLHAQGEIVHRDGRYRLTLKVREGEVESERVIESQSCSDLAGAAAVALGLLIRFELQRAEDTSTERRDATSGSPQPANASEPQNSAIPTESQPTRAAQSTQKPAPGAGLPSPASSEGVPADESVTGTLVLRAPFVGLDIGPLPAPAVSLGLAIGVRLRGWDLSLATRANLPQSVWSRPFLPPEHGAQLNRASVELRGCYRLDSGNLEGGPCLQVGVDGIRAEGEGEAVRSDTTYAAVFGAGAGAFGRWRLTPSFALGASLGAQIEMSRPRFAVDGLGQVVQLSPFAFSVNIGPEWIL